MRCMQMNRLDSSRSMWGWKLGAQAHSPAALEALGLFALGASYGLGLSLFV